MRCVVSGCEIALRGSRFRRPIIADVRIIHYACAESDHMGSPADRLANEDSAFANLGIFAERLTNYGCAKTGRRLISPPKIGAIAENAHRIMNEAN